MILFNPVTSKQTVISREELEQRTGKCNIANMIGSKVINGCYLLDDSTPLKVLRDLMAKEYIPDEKWKVIPGTSKQVSNYGRFRGVRYMEITMSLINNRGMVSVNSNNEQRFVKAYKLVAEAFLKPEYEDLVPALIDLDLFNNHVSNIEFVEPHVARVREYKIVGKRVIEKIDLSTGRVDDEYHCLEVAADMNYLGYYELRKAFYKCIPVNGYIYRYSEVRRWIK